MHLTIRHETVYTYSAPLAHTIQQLHLTPHSDPQQRVLSWDLTAPGEMHAYTDAFGNLSHMMTLDTPHSQLTIVAGGVVETRLPERGRISTAEKLSPLVFTVPTRFTEAGPEILALAGACLGSGSSTSSKLLQLCERILHGVRYQTGATGVESTATEAVRLGQGVCQDHAHIFIACCLAAGIPARYVSGYIDPENTGHAASHAWVDGWVDDGDYSGWVSFDVTHARLMTDAYCRLAIGRDYDGAAPIRGVRRGGGTESMLVQVQIVPQ